MGTYSGGFSSLKRFSGKGSNWGCRWNTIQFSTSCDIILLGIGLYGGADNSASVKIFQVPEDKEVTAVNKVEFGKCTIVDGIARIFVDSPVTIPAGASYDIEADMSGPNTDYGIGGQSSVEADGVTFSFRKSERTYSYVDNGPIPEIYFQKVQPTEMKKETAEKEKMKLEIAKLTAENKTQSDEIEELKRQLRQAKDEIAKLAEEYKTLSEENEDLKSQLCQSKIVALQCAKRALKFEEREKLAKLYVTIQLENGALLYFDNAKTSLELFTEIDGSQVNADLSILKGEYDCSYKGTIGNSAYFSAVKGKIVRFFKSSLTDNQLKIEQISELKTSDLMLFEDEPLYFIEESTEWIVYKYDENYEEVEGEKFNISGLRFIRKYKVHYHRGMLYFFRENTTPKLEKLNDKVVIVEGPVLDGPLSFHTPPHSDLIYITNSDQNVIITLDTTNLNVSQQSYEPPIESDHHSIVGVHEGILTMVFEGKGGVGRWLYTTRLQ